MRFPIFRAKIFFCYVAAALFWSVLLPSIAQAQTLIAVYPPSNLNPCNLHPGCISPLAYVHLGGRCWDSSGAGIPNCTISLTNFHHVDGTGEHNTFNSTTGAHPLPPDSSATDPKVIGTWDPDANAVTDANGFIIAGTYTMPEAAGLIDFTATFTCPSSGPSCGGGQDWEIQSQVPGLAVQLPIPSCSANRYQFQATSSEHSDTGEYLRPDVANRVELIPVDFQLELGSSATAPCLNYTAESLAWGGMYDLCGTWNPGDACPPKFAKPGHNLHRRGTSIDLSMGDIPASQRRALLQAIHDEGLNTPFSGENSGTPTANHWHMEQQ